ncbi:MAG: hypothetical protein R2824_09455 [Saprospiraceae bacterium]|nr:hypothetical protein [Lewinella sp.]
MKLKNLLWCAVFMALGQAVFGQQTHLSLSTSDRQQIDLYEDTLAVLGYAVVNDSLADNRFLACREMIVRLKQALKAPGSFAYPFDRLKSISIQYPQDSSFRIFSWQLYVDKDEYRYFGAIQMKSQELELIPMQDRSFQITEDPEKAVLDTDHWYGALYYNIKRFDTPDGPDYLLFGFDGYEFYYKRKVIDVLRIRNGKATFGAPVFYHPATAESPESTKSRIVREYSAAATVRVNYDPTYEMIMFDHLVPGGGQYGEGITYYPDGSYEGYRLQSGKWIYVEKVFNQVSAEAPRDYPVLKGGRIGDNTNIFGNKGRGRGKN